MELFASPLPVRTFRLPSKEYKTTRGLAERYVRTKLKRAGYLTWRGQFFDMPYARIYETYERIWMHYEHLKILLYERVGHTKFNEFLIYCKEHHGTPDLVAYHKTSERLLFIEVKYQNESLQNNQFQCIQFIRHHLEIPVEIHRVIPQGMRVIHGEFDAHHIDKEISLHKIRDVHRTPKGGELSLKKFFKKSSS